jgi:hypothetical protein
VIELRALVPAERVLHGELVEAELGLQLFHVVFGRLAVVDPDDRVGRLQHLGDVRNGKVLFDERPVAVRPGARHQVLF